MDIVLTEQDKQQLVKNYPELYCSIIRNRVWGTLFFACSYDKDKREIIYGSSFGNYIQDSYEIRIDFRHKDTFGFPKVFEDSEIIKSYMENQAIEPEDLHINKHDNNSCCLGIFPEYKWKGVSSYIQDKIVPFFYWQSYRRQYREQPWEGCEHGNKGLQQWIQKEQKKLYAKNKLGRNELCPCNGGKKYKKCHLSEDKERKSLIEKVKSKIK